MFQKILRFGVIILLSVLGFQAGAQVTTSGITGTVSGPDGQPLPGATIRATHLPSGSVYQGVATGSGVINMQGMRPGGPYTIEISHAGMPTKTLENVQLLLGEPFVLSEQLNDQANELENVVVTGLGGSRLNRNKTGASTNISTAQLNTLPTLTRSIEDFTRITPQARGNSFAGRDGRYNNFQVDGANFNNGFGLNDDPLPGGGGLSIDAIEEIQVNIAPYDVRQGGFTGAGINAVTRSGTNKFQGSAYHFFRNENLIGEKVNGEKISGLQPSSNKTYGFRLGGPIIKNKLFFFVNAERIDMTGPSAGAVNLWRASENGVADPDQNITRVRRSDLEAVRNHLQDQWGYDPGAYEGYADGESFVNSILARIDWNISDKHKLAIRYNKTNNEIPNLTNGNSGPYPRANFNNYSRVGQNAMSFENSMYFTANDVQSYTLELNSQFSTRVSNQFLATYSKINTGRTSPSAEFPFIDIGDGLGTESTWFNYISAGYELFTYNNKVLNDNYTFINNVSYSTGKHSITGGVSFEMQEFANNYMREGTSYYRYASVEDFLKTGTAAEVAPIQFALTYPYPGQEPWSRVKYALPAVYLQDNIAVNPRFNLTLGLRAEIPMFVNDLTANPVVDTLRLLSVGGSQTTYSSSNWPKTRVMLSPRVGFRYDVQGDRSLVFRGGTGIFAGRVPFVWLTNMPSNTGVIQNLIEPGSYAASSAWIGDIRFNPDKLYWLNNTPASARDVFITSPQSGVPGSLALVDEDFKMPQVWRSSIGADFKLGASSPFTLTADFLYSKDLQAVYQFGANRKPATETMYDGRDFYPNSAAYTYNSALGGNSGSVLSNTTMGNSMNFTIGLNMAPRKGFSGSLAYSHTTANTTTDNSGSNASSAWGATPNRSNPNDIFLAPSIGAIPHRVVGTLSYRKEYLNHLATTISLYYSGATQGRYSYTYNGDVNGDAIAGDLLYIPNDASEINFVEYSSGGQTYTVQQQVNAFNELMNNSDYLDKNRGTIAQRNGALMPWLHRWDARLLQDIFTDIGNNRNTLQFSLDVVNLANLLNSNWGIQQGLIANANTPLSVVSKGPNPTFRMNTASINGTTQLPTSMYRDVTSFGTTWSIQVGIRYLFN